MGQRKILFRGRCLDDSWVYGSLVQFHNGIKNVASIYDRAHDTEHMVNPSTIGQFTGEANLFEGDLMRSYHFTDSGVDQYLYHVIRWSDKYLCWYAMSRDNKETECGYHGNPQLFVYLKNAIKMEVTGTIHDATHQPESQQVKQ